MHDKDFWNERARTLGDKAGTQDRILKELEMRAILFYVKDGDNVLDVGCGDGETGERILRQRNVWWTGVDYSEEMIKRAQERLGSRIALGVIDVSDIGQYNNKFDVIYSERSIINLATWGEQKSAIVRICENLKPGGIYVMCESFLDDLWAINSLRSAVNLPDIVPPSHNLYLDRRKVFVGLRSALEAHGVDLDDVIPFASTYYFLSRVVNAALAQRQGKEPDYNSEINRLALELDHMEEMPSQTKILVWRKRE